VLQITGIEVIPLTGIPSLNQTGPVHAIIRIATNDATVGIGRASASSKPTIDEDLAPLLIGENPLNVERLWARMYGSAGQRAASARAVITAIGALDIALWDLVGKILGAPVHRLLGGYRDTIPAYADGAMIARGPAGHAEWSARSVASGYRSVKYHVMGEGPDQIVETVRQIRHAVGPDVQVMVDVHKLWDPWLGIATARRLEEYDVFWIEEPITWDDQVRGMAILAAGTRIPIAAGESEFTVYACRDLVERAGIRVLQTDILGAGGYTAWRKMAAVADAYHVKAAPHGASFPELAGPLQAALPNGLVVSAFPAGEPIEIWSQLYREPLDLRDGLIHLTDRPGLGLEFDDAFIRAHRA
jgi:L-alanine-DL-glutamate epimerase-like enolase superfamily enzyme